MLHYHRVCDFQGFKVSQGKVRTLNRWLRWDHLSIAYSLCKITGIGQVLFKLQLAGWYTFRDSVQHILLTEIEKNITPKLFTAQRYASAQYMPVSYTHLTLPTILRV